MPDTITPKAEKIHAALERDGGWCRRSKIAELIGQNQLNPHDLKLLERLENAGKLEVKKRELPGWIDHEYMYRAV